MEKRNDWFLNYHETEEEEGLRQLKGRDMYFDDCDFKYKSVIDLGCNSGQMCEYAVSKGALSVVGVDYDETAINKAKEKPNDRIQYVCDDLDSYFFYANQPRYNTTLLLSVIGTKELNNRYGILSRASGFTDEVMYLEGHHNSVYEELLRDVTMYTDFKSIEYRGKTYDNPGDKIGRYFFKLSKKMVDRHFCLNKIVELLGRDDITNIAVMGKGCVGKSSLRGNLVTMLNNLGYCFELNYQSPLNPNECSYCSNKGVTIYDDVYYKNPGKAILFDYRASDIFAKNGQHVDAIFYIHADESTRLSWIKKSGYVGTASCRNNELGAFSFKYLYNVKS